MKISSSPQHIDAPIFEVFDFLCKAEHIGQILPPDKIKDFKFDQDSCSFKVQAGVEIALHYVKQISPSLIELKSGSNPPFPYSLKIHLKTEEEGCSGYMEFNGDVNLFVKMMVEKPLTNLFNEMAERLKAIFKGEKTTP